MRRTPLCLLEGGRYGARLGMDKKSRKSKALGSNARIKNQDYSSRVHQKNMQRVLG